MKRMMLSVGVVGMLLACALLSGCGDSMKDGSGNDPYAPGTSAQPNHDDDLLPEAEDLIPDALEPDRPDMADGEVRDRDGIIEEHDTGAAATRDDNGILPGGDTAQNRG